MAIANYAAYAAYFQGKQRQRIHVHKTSRTADASVFTGTQERLITTWTWDNSPGTYPTTAVAPTNTTTGAWRLPTTSGTRRLIAANVATTAPTDFHLGNGPTAIPSETIAHNLYNSSTTASSQIMPVPHGLLIIYDRLSHQGGLGNITNSTNTTNLPTAALTRYTSGVGVEAMLENQSTTAQMASATGNGQGVTISYTDDAGNTGNTSPRVIWSVGNPCPDGVTPLPLATGDRGVRAIASIVDNSGFHTNGTHGLVLYYPIAVIPILTSLESGSPGGVSEALIGGGCWFPAVESAACLSALVRRSHYGAAASNNTGASLLYAQQFSIELTICED